MMYKKNLVACVKVNGKVLREKNDRVELPFGSEYSILLKNLDTVRMQVKVSIDGQDATDGTSLVLNAGSNLELERFIRNGNLNSGNRFKFIERTEAVEDHRGIKAEDGLIRVEYRREKVYQPTYSYTWTYAYPSHPSPGPCWPVSTPTYYSNNTRGLRSRAMGASANSGTQMASINLMKASEGSAVADFSECCSRDAHNDTGITVPGSISTQQFYTTNDFATEAPEVLVLHLVGRRGDFAIGKPITVDLTPICVTCGRHNKATSNFCSQCGTSLSIV
jgi:zinc-ribbon domain